MPAQPITTTDFSFPGQTKVYHGKVRDTYAINGAHLVSIATDRISAFDVILPRAIPHKGQVLNQLAAHFLQATADIVPNWLLAVPDPNASIGLKAKAFKIELVVRGCLVGYSWRQYQSGVRTLCGAVLPDNMQQYDHFPEPIITPSTKVTEGHDEDITGAEIVADGFATEDQWQQLQDYALKLFARGQEMAAAQGLILADTKYEFGVIDDQIILIDEVHTPDSSRYFYRDSYQTYVEDRSQPEPKHLSKEFVREWLLAQNFSGQAGATPPEMDDEFVAAVSERYIELYEQLTGKTFEPADDTDPLARIEAHVLAALEDLA